MSTKIGTSFGLAMLLAIGVIATMLAFGFFSPSKALADVDVEDIVFSKSGAASNAQITITFSTDTRIPAGAGQITVTFDKTWGIPGTMSKDHITITTAQTTGGTSNPAIDPTVVAGANSTVVTITVGDTNPSAVDVQSLEASLNGTAAITPHILVFSPLAGVTNPTSQGTAASAWIHMVTSADATATDGAVPTTGSYAGSYSTFSDISLRAVSLSPTSGTNGTSVTATGKGYVTGSLTAFIDTNNNGAIDSTETVLGTSATAVSGGTATVTFTASVPTFGTGSTNVNMIDGNGNGDASSATFDMLGAVTTSVTEAKRGQTITVKVRQYDSGNITSITIGGSGADLPSTVNVGSSGSLDLSITIPTTTPLGTQRVNVVGAETRFTSIDIVGAPLTLSPATVVIAQKITVSGSGFTGNTDVSKASDGCTTGGDQCDFSIAGTRIVSANINTNATVTTDNSGNMVATVTIPSTTQTQTAGTYTFQVVDNTGRTGQATLTIPSRTLTLEPDSSRRGSTVTITGSGFPASSSVSFVYDTTTVGSVTPDSVGGFTTTFTVPTSAGIPSTNTVTGTSSTDSLTGTATHKVPGATITIAEASSVSGETITISGTGFPGFATLTGLTIGGVSAIPTPAPATDTNGDLTAFALVPQLALGTQAVLVTVGGITANTSVTVTAAPEVPAVTTNATETVFADEIASDNLVRVWRFSNADQTWSFYDPRPAFAAANTLTDSSSGDIVWVNVTAETTFQGATLYPGWNLISLD